VRTQVAAVAIAFLAAQPIAADDSKPDRGDKPLAPALKVGDSAPVLTVTKWLSDDPVLRFEPGKVYGVEFWATWCVPCIRHMPHLAAVQARYSDQGVTVIGFTSREIRGVAGNTEDKVAAFVKRRGPMLKYAIAYADDATTTDAWLKASGRDGFCNFVVDRSGRIAYMGSPLFLDMVLPKVLAGANAKTVGEEMAKVVADYDAACAFIERDKNPDAFLRGLAAFEAKYPPLAGTMPACVHKLDLLLQRDDGAAGTEYAKSLVAKADGQDNLILLDFAYVILHHEADRKDRAALAARAAEGVVRIDGGTNAWSLLRLAEARHGNGDSVKAKEAARRAIAAAAGESPADRQEIEKEARKFVADK
jgi:thiol-disulfide isomerase/thioredoxin